MTQAVFLANALNNGVCESPAEADLVQLVLRLSDAAKDVSALVARGALEGVMHTVTGEHADGDVQKILDLRAHDLMMKALSAGGVAAVASEEADEPVILDESAPYVVAMDPVDGSTNIETNTAIGTIFAILPRGNLSPAEALLQPGRRQVAAGFALYGPQTIFALTLGRGVQTYTLDPQSGQYVETVAAMRVPKSTQEYAINASNSRHWDTGIRAYIEDCLAGEDGPREKNFNTRWVAAVVADAFRILVRGGVYLYPGDRRRGYTDGRLRLTYEANPIAFLMEQAGGKATDGVRDILDIEPASIHQRVPLIFGSAEEVDRVSRYLATSPFDGDRSPLFSERSLFRA
jgi:fructose-1,6-bisphosphatase I